MSPATCRQRSHKPRQHIWSRIRLKGPWSNLSGPHHTEGKLGFPLGAQLEKEVSEMEETHVAPGEAGVPGSGQGEGQGILCCNGLAVPGVTHSMTCPPEGTSWYQGCPSVRSPCHLGRHCDRKLEPQHGARSQSAMLRRWELGAALSNFSCLLAG